MANALLTATAVTRESLRILHQKLGFVGNVNRQYDASFAKSGAKIGDSLKIRLPNQYSVRTGATLSTQDTTETSTTLQVSTQKGVDLNFTSSDLTLSLDDFSTRILEPAMSVLAAAIESDALNMRKDVFQQVNNTGAVITFAKVLEGRKKLVDSLAPAGTWNALLNTTDSVNLVDALKGLFQDSKEVATQYREGKMGRGAGFDFMESTHLSTQLRGAGAGYLVNDTVASGDSTVTVDTGTGTIKQGEIVTFAGVNSVHPETKADSGVLQQFVVTADHAGGAGTIPVSPAFISTGATQNVSALPADNAAITIAGTASTNYGQSLLFHPDAFAFATADLVMPSGVDFARREVLDGISMRVVRQYDINADRFPTRLDVLYGQDAAAAARLPAGEFGGLILDPLQGRARREGPGGPPAPSFPATTIGWLRPRRDIRWAYWTRSACLAHGARGRPECAPRPRNMPSRSACVPAARAGAMRYGIMCCMDPLRSRRR